MNADWRDEARGIEPWKPARLLWVGGSPLPPGVVLYYGIADLSESDLTNCVIDLADPDVCAAFDRRLALRLGAPEEAVREGVRIGRWKTPRQSRWEIRVGAPDWMFAPDCGEGVDDPLLFRVRAWKMGPGMLWTGHGPWTPVP